MILVTGATGNMGRHLVRHLREAGAAVRAVTRDARKAEGMASERVEIAAGDLTDPEFLERAFIGVRSLFTLLEVGDATAVLEAAGRAGVARVVLVTSLLAQTLPEGFVGQLSLGCEKVMRDRGLAGTVLRPWEFTTNTLAWADEIRAGGVVRKPSAGLPSPAIDPADVAAIAAKALLEDGHIGRTYALTGPAELVPQDKIRALSAVLGRELRFEENGDAEKLEQIRRTPDQVSEGFGVCFMASPGVLPTALEVLGRPPRTYQEWAADNAGRFR
ncbi:SDR family oxidoreductase [Pendulispora albinea]|uniref:NAD(P)H-binding protein n=1 Tax=Pendulispora albinea TaxID=2741071 RepID=A0ABZ2LZP0_9BACT